MDDYVTIEGDLIKLGKESSLKVIVHGCNCFNTQGAGIAKQMVNHFNTNSFELENKSYYGDINKLGCIDYQYFYEYDLYVVNDYTQYRYGRNHIDGDAVPVDYEAIILCMRKLNKEFRGLNFGLPKIGCGLAGGEWYRVEEIIKRELKDCRVTVVEYKQGE